MTKHGKKYKESWTKADRRASLRPQASSMFTTPILV